MKKRLFAAALILTVFCSACTQTQPPSDDTAAAGISSAEPSVSESAEPSPIEPVETIYSGVKTDYSGLTPYDPPAAKHARLYDGPMPELALSYDYGLLLPYEANIKMVDGYAVSTALGFVTADGVIVTDPIYYGIYRPSSLSTYEELPVYNVSIVNEQDDTEDFFSRSLNAACALDGSWMTPFDYEYIIYTDNVMFMMRDYENYDIDVYDYNGQLLYNVQELDYLEKFSETAMWPGGLGYNCSDLYTSAQLTDGTIMFINVLSGAPVYTHYTATGGFYDGLASVCENGLWGYINENFEYVLPPKYMEARPFLSGRAIVTLHDNSQHLINKRGEILLSAPPEGYIDSWYNGGGYTMMTKRDGSEYKHFTEDLEELPAQKKNGGSAYVTAHGGGWYSAQVDGGASVFTRKDGYLIPDAEYVQYVEDGYVVYYDADWRSVVVTAQGKVIIPHTENASISPALDGNVIKSFMMNTYTVNSETGGRHDSYRLFDKDGSVIAAGTGAVSYNSESRLYEVRAEDAYSFLDENGSVVISIPLMSYLTD